MRCHRSWIGALSGSWILVRVAQVSYSRSTALAMMFFWISLLPP
jgi:hypothetical protein